MLRNRRLMFAVVVAATAGGTRVVYAQGGLVQSELRIAADEAGFGGDLGDGDRFGGAVAWLGDLDGDGLDELAVGAPGDDDGATDAGAVYVLFPNADGTVRAEQKISALAGGFGTGLQAGDRFGSALAGPGDLDADGVPDLVVGATFADDGGVDRGAVWLLRLNADGTVHARAKIASGAGGFAGSLADGDAFGSAVAGLGDQDGDGNLDLAVGAPGDDTGGTDQGAVWVLLLDAQGGVQSATRLAAGQGGFAGTLHAGDAFGASVAALGDVDGDGHGDLAVGAPGDDDGGADRGAAWVLSLDASGGALGQAKISASSGGFAGPLADGDHFGAGVAGLGDIEGNGVPDLLVGAPGSDGAGPDEGAVWYVLLDSAGATVQELRIAAGSGGFVGPLGAGDAFGSSVAAGGDLDGLAGQELAAGAPGNDRGGPDRGAAWELFTAGPASQVQNPGSGTNPNALTGGTMPPRIGHVWDPIIDLLVGGRGSPIYHFLGISDREFKSGSAGRGFTVFGQLLIDPGSLVGIFVSVPGRRFQVPIPADPTLVGLALFTQGAQLDAQGLFLTNGLNIVIGL